AGGRRGGPGLAPSAKLGAHVLETGSGLRQGRGVPGEKVAGEVQRRRPYQLVRPGLRSGARTSTVPAEPHLLRHVGQRTVPAALRTSGGRPPLATPNAGVVPGDHRPPGALCTRDPVDTPALRLAGGSLCSRPSSPPGRRERGPGFLRERTPLRRHRDAQAAWPDSIPPPDPTPGAAAWSSRGRPHTLASAPHVAEVLARRSHADPRVRRPFHRRSDRPVLASQRHPRHGGSAAGAPHGDGVRHQHGRDPSYAPAIRLRKRPMTHTDLALYRRLLREAWPYRPHIAGLLLLSLLSTPIALLVPLQM